jgi:ABC-type glycerol-3-phosphate transport system substrate-binding protein
MKPEMTDISEIIPVPKMDGAAKDPATFLNSSSVYGFVINKASFEDAKKKDAIASLMDLITSEAMFKELVKGGVVPTRKMTLDYSTINPMMKKAYEYSDKLERDPAHFNTIPDDAANTTYQNTLDELFAGATTPEAFVNKVQADLDKAKK